MPQTYECVLVLFGHDECTTGLRWKLWQLWIIKKNSLVKNINAIKKILRKWILMDSLGLVSSASTRTEKRAVFF